MARDPEPVSDRIGHEQNEYYNVGDDQNRTPGLPRRQPPPGRSGLYRARFRNREGRRHRWIGKFEAGRVRAVGFGFKSARDLLDAADHFVHGFVDRYLVIEDTVRSFGPHIFVVENRELVVLCELKRCRAGLELVIDRLAMMVCLPKWRLLALLRHRKPASERPFDIGCQVFFLQHEFQEVLGLRLLLGVHEDYTDLDGSAVNHWLAVWLLGESRSRDLLLVSFLAGGAYFRRCFFVISVVEPLRGDRD